ncbi:MAG: hypothetical protein AAF688_14825 [Bacteroidota bacterium]
MKNYTILIVVYFVLNFCFGQDSLAIVKANSSWPREMIEFPVEWAPKMNINGYEELRFSPNWSKADNYQFWTLVMAWEIESKDALAIDRLTENLTAYFDGLMIPNHWAETFPKPKFKLIEVDEDKKSKAKGTLTVFDGFHTGKMIKLNIEMIQSFINSEESAIVVFYISPKPFEHFIWNELKSIKIKKH